MADDVRERVRRQPCKDRDSDAMCDVMSAKKPRRVVEICTKNQCDPNKSNETVTDL